MTFMLLCPSFGFAGRRSACPGAGRGGRSASEHLPRWSPKDRPTAPHNSIVHYNWALRKFLTIERRAGLSFNLSILNYGKFSRFHRHLKLTPLNSLFFYFLTFCRRISYNLLFGKVNNLSDSIILFLLTLRFFLLLSDNHFFSLIDMLRFAVSWN